MSAFFIEVAPKVLRAWLLGMAFGLTWKLLVNIYQSLTSEKEN